MSLALKIANGTITQIGAADNLDVNSIRQNAGGNPNLLSWAANVLTLGVVTDTIAIPGNLEVDGTMTVSSTATYEGNVNLGNGGDTINIGSGTDTVSLLDDLTVGNNLVGIGSSTTDFLSQLWLAEVTGSAGNDAVNLRATGAATAGAFAIGHQGGFTNFTPTDNSVAGALAGIDAAIGAASGTLQQAYVAGNTISVTAAEGSVALSNSTDAQDVLTVDRTSAGPGRSLVVTTGASVTGAAAFINNAGTGNALQVQDGGSDVLVVSGAGAVTVTPTSGENFNVTTAAGGTIDLTSVSAITLTSSGSLITVNGSQGVDLQQGGNTHIAISAVGGVDLNPASGQDLTGTVTGGGDIVLKSTVGGGDVTVGSEASGGPGGNTYLGATSGSGSPGGTALVAGASGYPLPGSGQLFIDSISGTEIQYLTNLRILVEDKIELTPASGADVGVICTGAGGDFSATTEDGTITIETTTGGILDVKTSTASGTAGNAGIRSTATTGTTGTLQCGTQATTGTAREVSVGAATTGAGGTAEDLLLVSESLGTGSVAGNVIMRVRSGGTGSTNGDIEITNTTLGSAGTTGDILVGAYTSNGTVGGVSIKAGTSAPAAPSAQNVLIVGRLGVTIEAETSSADLTFDARGMNTPITLNESGDEDLDGFTATSIVGALNEVKAGVGATVVTFGTSTASAGDVVKISASDTLAPADAGDGEAATIGIQINGAAPYKVVVSGEVSGLSVTAATRYFVGASGALTSTAPSTSGDLIRRIGWAKTGSLFVVSVGEGTLVP